MAGGTNWTQLTPATSPSPRYFHTMVYDKDRHVALMFGGFSNTTFLGDTWEWDGANWAPRISTNKPSRRSQHSMAYDSIRGVTVMCGGWGDLESSFDGTWEFGLCPLCDLNESGIVDGTDFSAFLLAYGYCTGEPNFNDAADLDQDGCVTLVDYQRWLQCYRVVVGNTSAPAPTPSDAGDLNADGQADGLDIQAFVERMSASSPIGFRESFVADFTGDGQIDLADIPGLTEALLR